MLTENPLRALIMIVIVAPVIEEMMFRSLLKPSHIELILLSWSGQCFSAALCSARCALGLKIGFYGCFLFTFVYIAQQLIPPERTLNLRNRLNRYEFLIWIVSSLVFGFVHITNYVDHFTINLALFLLILPRILAGFMIGWVKINNKNLPWAMALHAINNGMAFFFIYFSL